MKVKRNLLLVILVILSISLCGCNNENDYTPDDTQTKLEDMPGKAFEGKNLDITEINGEISFYCVKKDKLYIMTYVAESNTYQIYSCDLEGNNTVCVVSDINEKYISAFHANENGELLYLSVNIVEDKNVYELVKINVQSLEQKRCDVSNCFENIDHANDEYKAEAFLGNYEIKELAGILLRQDGSAIIGIGENVYVYDEMISNEKKIDVPQNVLTDIALTKNGDIVCVTDELESDMVNINTYILNMENLTWSDAIDIRIGEAAGKDVVMDGDEYDFYYESRIGINGYSVEKGEAEVLINQFKSYIGNEELDGLQPAKDNIYIGTSKEYIEHHCNLNMVSWKEVAPDADKDKTVITLGVYFATSTPAAVTKFNRNHNDCKIQIIDYSEMDEERMIADIIAGKMPDIISVGCLPISVKQCANKGLIEELTPYYENDPECNVEDLLPEVYEAEMEDGGLYYVASSFSIDTMLGRTEDVGDADGWTVKDLKSVMDKKGKNAELFDMKDTRIACLDTLLENTVSDYVDWDNGVCHFDSDEFKYLMELAYSQGTKEEDELNESDFNEMFDTEYSRFHDGEYLILDEYEFSLHMMQFEREALGIPLNYIGYPNKSGDGSYFDFGDMFAISAKSENKDLAWEFLKELLSKEYQVKNVEGNDSSMPVMKSSFDEHMKALTTTTPYINEFGELVEPLEEYDISWGDYSVKVGVAKEEDVNKYMEILHRTKHAKTYETTILKIVYEEAQYYFLDKKGLDKTIDAIQNRVTTYINEQR